MNIVINNACVSSVEYKGFMATSTTPYTKIMYFHAATVERYFLWWGADVCLLKFTKRNNK